MQVPSLSSAFLYSCISIITRNAYVASFVSGNTSAVAGVTAGAVAVEGTVDGATPAGCDDVSLQAEQRSNVDKMTV